MNARPTAENKKGMKTISRSWLGYHIYSHHHQSKEELSLQDRILSKGTPAELQNFFKKAEKEADFIITSKEYQN